MKPPAQGARHILELTMVLTRRVDGDLRNGDAARAPG